MALLNPLASGYMTQAFGVPSSWEPKCYHYGTRRAAFYKPNSNYSLINHFHCGMDWADPQGTAIRASEDGVVVYSNWAQNPGPYAGGGYVIEVAVHGGARYASAHCSRLLVGFGAKVKRGQIIAFVGETGTATGPHDHFAVSTVSVYGHLFYNPAEFLPGGILADSPLIKPYSYKLATSDYASPRRASIAPNSTVNGYTPSHIGGPVETFKATSSGSGFWVKGKQTITWPGDSTPPVPHGTFLLGMPKSTTKSGGVFANLDVPPSQVKAADGKPW
jgi:hypothetical protein